jgi:hypothetical protein
MTRRTLLSMPLAAAAPRRSEFPLGLYQLPRIPNAMQAAHAAGFNLVNLPPERARYNEAQTQRMRAWSSVGTAEDRIRKLVPELKDHPALWFWETEDEPSFAWKKPRELRTKPETIIAAYRLIKRLDPAHPVYLNHSPTNLEATLRQYNPGCDIVATDIYPVIPHGIRELFALWPDGRQGDLLNNHISQVGQYADKMRRVAGADRKMFMVLQAFAWEALRKEGQDPRMVLYPTRAQTRFMAYQALVHGADGLLWWGISYAPPESSMWADLCFVVRELADLRRDLVAPRRELPLKLDYHDTGHSLDRGIEWAVRGSLLMMVNADPNPIEVTVDSFGRLTFPPFGVQLRRLT